MADLSQMFWKPWTAQTRKEQVGKVDFRNRDEFQMTTFRKGAKWCQPELIGRTIELIDEKDGKAFASARVVSVKACAWKDITEEDHALQSSDMLPNARLTIMRSVYGEYDDTTLTTVVTLGDVHDYRHGR